MPESLLALAQGLNGLEIRRDVAPLSVGTDWLNVALEPLNGHTLSVLCHLPDWRAGSLAPARETHEVALRCHKEIDQSLVGKRAHAGCFSLNDRHAIRATCCVEF